jgi:mRNA-degrading endonuclease toxin of MazEF toxin-antitoxin module
MSKPAGWYPRRGEVYLCGLDKKRPAVILSVDAINKFALDVCVVGITTVEHTNFQMRVPLKAGTGGLNSDSWAKCDQVTTLERSYLQYPPLGILPKQALELIEHQVRICLGLHPIQQTAK